LDPGVRKFLVGYDPTGTSVFIGEKANNEILNLFTLVDKAEKKEKYLLWKKIKNMISELHWKTVSFLTENYDIIILPEFKVSEMVKKKKLSRSTKRMMMMFSFFSFKEKLKWKCELYGKKLIIVDESYTSCTCTNCGKINNTQGKETLKCYSCDFSVDRDVAGARNILIKNIILN
jgi:putative transposase